MRICVVSSSVFPCPPSGYAGLEMISWECAKGLAKLGHEVTLIAPQGSSCPGVSVIECLPPGFGEEQAYGGCVLKDPNGNDVRWGGYWPKLLEFNESGVIIDHSWAKWAYMLANEGRLKAPILGIMHAPVSTMYQSLPPVENPCMVCISDDQRDHFQAYHSPRKARTCYNGIDLDLYKPMDVPRKNRFLFLARFSTIKGPDLAIQYCKEAKVGLDAVGDTSITQEPGYFEMCRDLARGTDIKIMPGIPRGETVWWYSQAHCFLHPGKRFREPFGLAPVEAMACGLPVICYDYGALRETVVQGETGWLVESDKELAERIAEAANGIPKQMRERCRENASRFSIFNMVKRYETLCEEALSKPW